MQRKPQRFRIPSALIAVLVSATIFLTVIIGRDNLVTAGEVSKVAYRTEEEERIIQVYKNANEATVFITTVAITMDPLDFFEPYRQQRGMGSGVIVDAAKGIILTNLHVLGKASQIEISLGDGFNHKANVIGFDDETDVAVLQFTSVPPKLVSVPLGDSSKLEVGQRVLAIGNPFGLNRTLTAGIVSSIDRTVKTPDGVLMKGLIQTDAAINPGNSGGPLLDTNGRLIGINTAILSQSGDSAGIGFAIPINQIKRILPELIATGKVLRPVLGWVLLDTEQGPFVYRTYAGGPAFLAGVSPVEQPIRDGFVQGIRRDYRSADLISKVNGKRVYSGDEVEEIISSAASSSSIRLTLKRGGIDGAERDVVVKPVLK